MDNWLDRSFGWLMSVGVHAALLLALTLVVIEGLVPGPSGEYGVNCAFAERGLEIERIDRPADKSGPKVKITDDPPSFDDFAGRGFGRTFFPPWTTVYVDEGEGWCGTCLHLFLEREGGNVRFVMIPRPPKVAQPLAGYAYRKRSLEENRTGMARLKNRWPAGKHPYFVTSSLRHLRD